MPEVFEKTPLPALPLEKSLRAWLVDTSTRQAELLFESEGKWLHPLFELRELWSKQERHPHKKLLVQDKVTGRAAAFLVAALGVNEVQTKLLSSRAREILDLYGTLYTAEAEIERIACMTEDLLATTSSLDIALEILNERRRLAANRNT